MSDTIATPAALTENELWRQFVTSSIARQIGDRVLDTYVPYMYLRDCGYNGFIDVISEPLIEEVFSSSEPSDALDGVIEDLKLYVRLLNIVQADFERLKQTQLIPSLDLAEGEKEDPTEDSHYHPLVTEAVEAAWGAWTPRHEHNGSALEWRYRISTGTHPMVEVTVEGRTKRAAIGNLPIETITSMLIGEMREAA